MTVVDRQRSHYPAVTFIALLGALCLLPQRIGAQDHAHHQDGSLEMSLDSGGMVMNGNSEILPRDCARISEDYAFTVHAGVDYARGVPGLIFGFSEHEFRIAPCSRVTLTLINDDQVRHQWMLHGLPKYLYPGGMFHLEAAGGRQRTGTFIVPSDAQTYLIHCDIAQHMEKGMKAQLIVGAGSGDLWSIPTISSGFKRAAYLPPYAQSWLLGAAVTGFVLAGLLLAIAARRN